MDTSIKSLPTHLGGHLNKTHTDLGAMLFAKDVLAVRSMIDVGCGPGGQVALAKNLNIASMGIDGDWQVDKVCDSIYIHDFADGPWKDWYEQGYDLGWSVEFLEHVEEKYLTNFMPIFTKCRYVFVTHATPGQPGHHHVNCQDRDYWIAVFNNYHLTYHDYYTTMLKASSTMTKGFIKKTGLVFTNDNIA